MAPTQSVSRVAVLTDSAAKGKLDFFAIDDAAPATSLEGRTPTVSLVLDGSSTPLEHRLPGRERLEAGCPLDARDADRHRDDP